MNIEPARTETPPKPFLSLGVAVLAISIGIILCILGGMTSQGAGVSLRLFTTGPAILFVGITLLIFPLTLPDGALESGDFNLRDIGRHNPAWKIAIWVAALAAGFVYRHEFLALVIA